MQTRQQEQEKCGTSTIPAHRKGRDSSLEANGPLCREPGECVSSKQQYTSDKGVGLVLDEVVVADEVDVGRERIEEQKRQDVDMQPERDGRVQRYTLDLWTLDEQRRRGWGRPGSRFDESQSAGAAAGAILGCCMLTLHSLRVYGGV